MSTLSASGNSYVSTVKTEANEFLYQPTTTVGATNGSSYRVTDMYYGDKAEQEAIQRVITIISAKKVM